MNKWKNVPLLSMVLILCLLLISCRPKNTIAIDKSSGSWSIDYEVFQSTSASEVLAEVECDRFKKNSPVLSDGLVTCSIPDLGTCKTVDGEVKDLNLVSTTPADEKLVGKTPYDPVNFTIANPSMLEPLLTLLTGNRMRLAERYLRLNTCKENETPSGFETQTCEVWEKMYEYEFSHEPKTLCEAVVTTWKSVAFDAVKMHSEGNGNQVIDPMYQLAEGQNYNRKFIGKVVFTIGQTTFTDDTEDQGLYIGWLDRLQAYVAELDKNGKVIKVIPKK